MKKGFTMLELIVVIIIIGILGTLGFTQYARVVEKGRSAEAKVLLGQVRSAQEAYRLESGGYTIAMGDLAVDSPTSCTATHYFRYSVTVANSATATRCTTTGAAGGKAPASSVAYTIALTYAGGVWSGSAGYY